MKKFTALTLLVLVSVFTLTSCEDTNSSLVEITISPEVPLIGTAPFEASNGTVEPNWFEFVLSFSNPTNERLIISDVTVYYKYGNQKEYGGETTLDPGEAQDKDWFLAVGAGRSGLEYQFLDNQPFARYLGGLVDGGRENFNYQVKMVFTGFFTLDTSSDLPAPSMSFEKVLYFRTKSGKEQ